MNLPEFAHFSPKSVQDTCVLLSKFRGEANILAGGTDLIVKMKHRRLVPKYVINIKRIPDLNCITYISGEGMKIGALATIEGLRMSPTVRQVYPSLHSAVSYMGTVEVRNRATLVGNVCNASPSAETIPSLIVLGARVRVVSERGERTVPIDGFFIGPGRTVVQPDELVVEIEIPEPPRSSGSAYEKHSLRRMDRAVVGVATMIAMSGEACKDVRIALSAVSPKVMRAMRAEETLRGRVIGEQLIDEAAWIAAGESRPRTGMHGTADSKRDAVGQLARQTISQAWRQASFGAGRRGPAGKES